MRRVLVAALVLISIVGSRGPVRAARRAIGSRPERIGPTWSSSSPTTWASPTPAATAARSRRRTSTGWRTAACGSRSSTTRPAAGRRGRASSPAIMPSRSGATTCPAGRRRRRRAAGLGAAAAGATSARSAIAPITRANGTWTATGAGGRFDHSYSLDDHDRYFIPTQHTLDDRPLPPVKPGSGYYTTTAIADHAIKMLKEHAAKHRRAAVLPVPGLHLPALSAARACRRTSPSTGTAIGPAGTSLRAGALRAA